MTAQELKDTGHRLFKDRHYAEALPLLRSAAEAFPKDETLWSELVLSASWSGQHDGAVEFAREGLRQLPQSDWLWRQLGRELTELDRLDEADAALNNARRLNPNVDWLWRYLVALHRKQKNLENEIDAIENLRAIGQANSTDLNELGIAYHNQRNFFKAAECYRVSAATKADSAPFFNMGLVFSNLEVSQDADASDAYRRALALKPDHEQARAQLESTKRRLIPLAGQARTDAVGLVQPVDFFQFYVNPFEALQLGEFVGDVKAIQLAKRRLLQEIDLNDGKVSWLGDHPFDASRVHRLDDELFDENKARYHWAVFGNKRLLRFLTRGEIEHFLYSDEYFPRGDLDLLDGDPGFRKFLSKSFARQYNVVLTRAVEGCLLHVVEALFDGRRWVDPEDEDICFEGAARRIDELVGLVRSIAKDGLTRKVDLHEIEDLLRHYSLSELLNLLPPALVSYQTAVVAEIRSLAISCFSEHGDPDLTKAVLGLCKRFTCRSVDVTKGLEEDFKTIEAIISTRQDAAQILEEQLRNRQHSKKTGLGWVVAAGIIIILCVIGSFNSDKAASPSGSHARPTPSGPSAYRPPYPSGGAPSDSETVYRVSGKVKAELDRDKQTIEREKGVAERMDSQLKSLGREVDQTRSYLDETSEFDVDQFNRKVVAYNHLLERVRAQDRLVNDLVDRYNAKLQQYGR